MSLREILRYFSLYYIASSILLKTIRGNTVLDDLWTPLSYYQCRAQGVEVVGSHSQGNTCNFNGAGSDYMPPLWTKKYLLAVSQDLYNGFHTADDFALDCDPYNQTETQTDHNCGEICGWCFLINGPNGAAIYIANEIADINAVGDNGRGINLHIDDDTIANVRDGLGVGYDIQYKKVPCPGTEQGIFIYYVQYNPSQTWKNAVYFTPINYRIGVKALYVRHGEGDADRNWYRLPRDWTNRYRYESWQAKAKWLDGLGSIHGTADHFDMKIVSHLSEEIICIGLVIQTDVDNETIQCLNSNGESQQFTDGGYSLLPETACDGSTLSPTLSPTKEPTSDQTEAPIAAPSSAPTDVSSTSPTTPSISTSPSISITGSSGVLAICVWVNLIVSLFIFIIL